MAMKIVYSRCIRCNTIRVQFVPFKCHIDFLTSNSWASLICFRIYSRSFSCPYILRTNQILIDLKDQEFSIYINKIKLVCHGKKYIFWNKSKLLRQIFNIVSTSSDVLRGYANVDSLVSLLGIYVLDTTDPHWKRQQLKQHHVPTSWNNQNSPKATKEDGNRIIYYWFWKGESYFILFT